MERDLETQVVEMQSYLDEANAMQNYYAEVAEAACNFIVQNAAAGDFILWIDAQRAVLPNSDWRAVLEYFVAYHLPPLP